MTDTVSALNGKSITYCSGGFWGYAVKHRLNSSEMAPQSWC